jgi:arsenate reductase
MSAGSDRPRGSVFEFDHVLPVCDNARESCPVLPRCTERIHWPPEDPAAAVDTDGERLAASRCVRGEPREAFQTWIAVART